MRVRDLRVFADALNGALGFAPGALFAEQKTHRTNLVRWVWQGHKDLN